MKNELLDAANGLLWKLNHNHDTPNYKGPARIDRNDAAVRKLKDAVEKEERP